jgi:hypothetical protein
LSNSEVGVIRDVIMLVGGTVGMALIRLEREAGAVLEPTTSSA